MKSARRIKFPGDHEKRRKKSPNLTTKEGGRCRQVEINVLEHDMGEKKKKGGCGWGED